MTDETKTTDLAEKIGKSAINGWIAALTIPNTLNSFRDAHVAAGRGVLDLPGVHAFAIPSPDRERYVYDQWSFLSADGEMEHIAAADHDGDVLLGITGEWTQWLTPDEAIALGERLIAAGLRGREVEKENEG